jgi:hypothetical protein
MELFCFLRMGGSPDRVTVLPVLEYGLEHGSNDFSNQVMGVVRA